MNKIQSFIINEKVFFSFCFIIILVFSRLIPHPPNFTPVIAAAIFGPIFLNDKVYGVLIPIISMFISDIIISFHSYQFVVYATLISISILTPSKKNKKLFFSFAIISCVWFYIATNFSVWIMSDYYPKTFDGLLTCYILAIPFFKNTFFSTIIFTFIFWYLHSIFVTSNFVNILRKNKESTN
tara:strand:- start:1656 stop:2201 length:546 start_codon:yes stop_codon:yes gene_type:complete